MQPDMVNVEGPSFILRETKSLVSVGEEEKLMGWSFYAVECVCS